MSFTQKILLVFLLILPAACLKAQSGKNGSAVISSTGTVNAYTILLADANAGATSIQVGDNALTSNFSAPLTTGDLIFIVQVQGAFISTIDDTTYGSILSYLNSGNNEFAEVFSVSGSNTIRIACPLKNDYSVSGRVQVIRVPRYSQLVVNSGGAIVPPVWNGSFGGVVALEVEGATIINSGGRIDASNAGFRPGVLNENLAAWGVLNYTWNAGDYGGEKGESIAGPTTDYDLMGGRYCKGAPANGGGGANAHNAGGGGGANASNTPWTGRGNPDLSNGYATAWNLEYNGFASSVSGGGGKGGYTFSSSNANAMTAGPMNGAWGGDTRRENGGRGGRPLDYSSGRIFMGGGGGSGDQNDNLGGIGGRGGGIIYIKCYDDVSGAGQISANGASGNNSAGTDGAGGGGGGGAIFIESTNVSGVSINANGGNGGNQAVSAFVTEAEGPGGGGGGGIIAISNGGPSRSTNGGNNGTTNSASLTEFPPNGATRGGQGIFDAWLPTFDLTVNPDNDTVCINTQVLLTASINGSAPAGTTVYWFSQLAGGTPVASGFTFSPTVTASVVYYAGTCPGIRRVPVRLTVESASASFTFTPNCAGNSTSFNLTASSQLGNITSTQWNFGDGGTSSDQNPTHIFNSGSYTVTVTATDNFGCQATSTQTVAIPSGPVAAFSTNANQPCNAPAVSFVNSSSGASSYTWNFGDGQTSNSVSPSHTYSGPGVYIVTLTANGGSCSGVQTDTIRIGTSPIASFTPSSATICLGDTIRFTNSSNGNGSAITSYNWNFGNGTTSAMINPVIIYPSAGTYNIQLTVTNNGCQDDTIRTVTVTQRPSAAFTPSVLFGCAPLTVNFSNTSTSANSYSWNFGDGNSSASVTPSHTFSSGQYTVILTATNGNCTSTRSTTLTFNSKPLSSFSISSTNVCLSDSIRFTNLSNGNGSSITSYLWDFGNGNTSSSVTPAIRYNSPGVYLIRLTVANSLCSDDTTITVTVNPGPLSAFAATSTSGCYPLAVSFSNTSTGAASYLWNFGDGQTSTATTPSHTYSSPGTYNVTLITTNGSCIDTLQRSSYITVGAPPLSSFSTGDVCFGDSMRFTNLSSNGANTVFTWNFGDGGSSSANSPAHIYMQTGQYTVTLNVSAAGCADDTTINVNVRPNPVAAFAVNAPASCDTLTAGFANNSSGGISYLWNFGDGQTSTDITPSHHYASAGNYTVSLTATNQFGCSTTRVLANAVRIAASPVVAFASSGTSVCTNGCITFTDQSSSDGISWNWTVPGGTPSSTSGRTPVVCYSSPGTYNVTLTVSNGQCQSSLIRNNYITVSNCSLIPTAAFISSDTIICSGSCISFSNLSLNATSYQWTFAGAQPSQSTDQHPQNICYSSPGVYPVKLISINPAGSDTFEVNSFINVVAAPSVPTVTNTGDTLSSSPANFYQWYYNGIAISGATQQSYVATLSGNYSVNITDGSGCSAISAQYYLSLTGVEDPDAYNLVVYPNPATDKLYFLSTGIPGEITFTVTDVTGRIIYKDAYRGERYDLDLNTNFISRGTYIFTFSFGDRTVYRRIIVS